MKDAYILEEILITSLLCFLLVLPCLARLVEAQFVGTAFKVLVLALHRVIFPTTDLADFIVTDDVNGELSAAGAFMFRVLFHCLFQ